MPVRLFHGCCGMRFSLLYQRIDRANTRPFLFLPAALVFFFFFLFPPFLLKSMGAGVILLRCKDVWQGKSLKCMWNLRVCFIETVFDGR